MKKNIKVIYLMEIVLLIVNLIFYLMIKVIPSKLNIYLVITFLLLAVIPLRLYFGKIKDNSYYLGYVNRSILLVLLSIGIIIYLLGIVLGFTRGYRYSFNNLFFNIIPIIILTYLIEYLRFIVVKNNYTNYKSTLVFTVLLTAVEVYSSLNIASLSSSYKIFVFISLIVLPALAENLLCTYLTYKVGLYPCLLFRLIIKLYIYILPIVPNLGNYLFSFVKILTPFIIFYNVNKTLLVEEKSKVIIKKGTIKIFSIVTIATSIILVILVSGIFRSRLIAVGSSSMAPVYYRGDAVIFEYIKPEELRKGDILVFNHGGRIITHRIVDIKIKQNTFYFNTKGDANDNEDGFLTSSKDVIGKVNYVIKYIGFPTVWVNELFERS